MHWFKLMLLMLPALGGSGDADVALQVTDGVNQSISIAVEAVDVAPAAAWELAARQELADSPKYADTLVSAIYSASDETGIDPAMLWCVAYTESHGRHWRENGKVKRGGAGEVGLMQIKPFWAKALRKKHGIDVDLYDVTDNILAGAHILLRGGDKPNVMLSYYNTGQKLRSTSYQRKVMRYWGSIEEIPATIAVKPILAGAEQQAPKAAANAPAVSAPAASESGQKVVKAAAKPSFAPEAVEPDAAKPEEKEGAPPQRSFRPE